MVEKKLKHELSRKKFTLLKHEAMQQVDSKADILDLNIGIGSENEPEIMQRAVRILDNTVTVPYLIDSDSVPVIEAGLKTYAGKAFINSVNGNENSYGELIPLAKKYGAGIIILPLDDNGIPSQAEERLKIAQKVTRKALAAGMDKNDILIDAIVLPLSSKPNAAHLALDTLRLIKKETDLLTICGASNISYGLPKRKSLNASFIAMAIEAGLDAVIANPSKTVVNQIYASSLLAKRDKDSENYIKHFASQKGEDKDDKLKRDDLTPYQLILQGAYGFSRGCYQ